MSELINKPRLGRPKDPNNPRCIYCGGLTRKMGYSRHGYRRYWCEDCLRSFTEGYTTIQVESQEELNRIMEMLNEHRNYK